MHRCMAVSHAGVHEQLLATEFEYGVKLAGASRLAYPVVAGGGADSCTIHYSRNDKQVRCTATSWVTKLRGWRRMLAWFNVSALADPEALHPAKVLLLTFCL